MGDDYATCQAWALALWRWFPDAAGLRYRARKAGADVANVALWLDRCLDRLRVPPEDARRLDEWEALVLAAGDLYRLTVTFPFRWGCRGVA